MCKTYTHRKTYCTAVWSLSFLILTHSGFSNLSFPKHRVLACGGSKKSWLNAMICCHFWSHFSFMFKDFYVTSIVFSGSIYMISTCIAPFFKSFQILIYYCNICQLVAPICIMSNCHWLNVWGVPTALNTLMSIYLMNESLNLQWPLEYTKHLLSGETSKHQKKTEHL